MHLILNSTGATGLWCAGSDCKSVLGDVEGADPAWGGRKGRRFLSTICSPPAQWRGGEGALLFSQLTLSPSHDDTQSQITDVRLLGGHSERSTPPPFRLNEPQHDTERRLRAVWARSSLGPIWLQWGLESNVCAGTRTCQIWVSPTSLSLSCYFNSSKCLKVPVRLSGQLINKKCGCFAAPSDAF